MKCPSKNYQCGRGFFRSISGHELNPTPNWSRLVGSDLIQGHPRSTYSIDIYIYYIYIYTWNPIDPCFDRKRPYLGWLVVQNRGHSGSGYTYNIYIYIMSQVVPSPLIVPFWEGPDRLEFHTNICE